MGKFLLSLLLAACSWSAFAQSGTITFGGLTAITVSGSSCAAFKTSSTTVQILSCSTDPVIVGTDIVYSATSYATAAKAISVGRVTALTAGPAPVAGTVSPVFQGSANQYVPNLATAVTSASGTTSSQVTGTVTVAPFSATPDQYTAVSTVFGLILCALAVTWGLKHLYRVLANPPEA